MRKSSGDFMMDSHDFETRERYGWWERGTLASIWTEISSGRFGMSCDKGHRGDAAAEEPAPPVY